MRVQASSDEPPESTRLGRRAGGSCRGSAGGSRRCLVGTTARLGRRPGGGTAPEGRRVDTRGTSRARRSGVGHLHKGRLPCAWVGHGGASGGECDGMKRFAQLMQRVHAGAIIAGRASSSTPLAAPPRRRPPHSPRPNTHARARAGRERRPRLPLGRPDESRPSLRRPRRSRRGRRAGRRHHRGGRGGRDAPSWQAKICQNFPPPKFFFACGVLKAT